jgi:hypothetical protein
MSIPSQFLVYTNTDGVIQRLPVKLSKKIELANWAATLFDTDTSYTEAEVNRIIGQYIEDFALIRRMLVTLGQLERDAYGYQYRKAANQEIPA